MTTRLTSFAHPASTRSAPFIAMTTASSEMAFFVLLAKKTSLAATARELNISAPAATRRLAQLEARLGLRLVHRTTRRLSLTAEGEQYLADAQRILDDIRAMEDALQQNRSQPRGLLRVNATLGFGRTAIAPVVSHFARSHPDVEVQLQLTDRPLNLVEEAFDVGIRFGTPSATGLQARRLLPNRRMLCAAPAYLKRAGTPDTPADLARHQCIIHRQNDEEWNVWRFSRGRRTESVRVSGPLSSNDGDVVLGWALDGHGILIRSEWDLARYLESGRLRQLLPDYKLENADLYAYYPTRQHLSMRVRSFLDFLAAELR